MLNHEPQFGKHVIETLSEGMYDNPLFLFREYVQNSADAIDTAVRNRLICQEEGQIEIVIDAEQRLITFEDNGIGIPRDVVAKTLANIGDSQKDRQTNKGFRGIGRLGGLGYCQKVRFETSARGESQKSVFEWDARNLHEILANKEENIHAAELIKRITSTWNDECGANTHFFKVSLIGINESSDELLNVGEVRKYLSMVAPVPFDYANFPFIKKIEKFIEDNHLRPMDEYQLHLNGDEVRKGYSSPLKIDGEREIEYLDVECCLLRNQKGHIIGWLWYGLSEFDGVLPKKCWQRSLRVRKANIQIGEGDCLSNHPRREQNLWKEDRGNNYFIGEVHAIDPDLIPNSRRDYFNQNPACCIFEAVLSQEFKQLHKIYHDASNIRSAQKTIEIAANQKIEFDNKDRQEIFYDNAEREKAAKFLAKAHESALKAQDIIEKYQKKEADMPSPTGVILNSIVRTPLAKLSQEFEVAKKRARGQYAKDNIKASTQNILDKVRDILFKMLPEDQATPIWNVIIKRFSRK